MFRKRRTILNGVELPEEFSGSSIINNVAISGDGTKYAYVSRDSGLVTGDMPEDGRLEVDGNVINYQKGTGRHGINVRGSGVYMSSISGGSVVISSGVSQISIGGSDLEFEVDKGYEGVNRVSFKESVNDVNLALSDDGKVYVKGLTSGEPEYKGERLFVDGLEGILSLPKSNPNLEIDIKTSAGDVDGEVAHKGIIRTSAGDISIELYAPLTVEANTSAGDVRVKSMISEGRGVYTPPNAKSLGTLVLDTSAGDIKVNYMLR
jgi:hypothetical protein